MELRDQLRQALGGNFTVERFEREVALAAALQHPHIVPLLSTGRLPPEPNTAGTRLPYYTMPFIRGESLRAKLSRSGEFSIGETIHWEHQSVPA